MGILDAPGLNKFTAPVYSVRPTGVASHDGPELQAALNDLPAAGGTVLLPRGAQIELGTTTISFPINKPVHMFGPGVDAATIHYAGTDAGIDLQGTGDGSSLPDASAVRDCKIGGFTIYGPNNTAQAGRGIRLNRTFRCDVEDVRAYGFANNSAPFGAGIYATASFYMNIRKYQTWTPDTLVQSYYGLLFDAAQNNTPVFLATVEHSSLWGCKRGAGILGNTILFEEVGFEKCDDFGATVDSAVNVGFLNCWWESIKAGAAGGTALRIGTSGSFPIGTWVRNSRFSSHIYNAIDNHGRRGRFSDNVFKPSVGGQAAAIPILESTGAAGNVYDNNYWDDASGTALDAVVQSTQQGGSGFGPSVTLLSGSGSKVRHTTAVENATTTFLASGSYTVPSGITAVEVIAVAGGGAGGNGGTALTSGGVATQVGGAGGASGMSALQTVTVTPGQVLTVTVGAGGAVGATTAANGQTGANGATGAATTVTGTGVAVTAYGGSGGGGGAANSTSAASGGAPGGSGARTSQIYPGVGGGASSTTGSLGMPGWGSTGIGGSGGGPASATLGGGGGGVAGAAGGAAAASASSAGVDASSAAANTGGGGGGGGAGAPGGTGGKGGAGGSGFVTIRPTG